jgi:hypothetical protein
MPLSWPDTPVISSVVSQLSRGENEVFCVAQASGYFVSVAAQITSPPEARLPPLQEAAYRRIAFETDRDVVRPPRLFRLAGLCQ